MADHHFLSGEHRPLTEETTSWEQGFSLMLKTISLMTIITTGSIENVLLIYVIVRNRNLHRAPYYFLINLSVADLLRSMLCLPFVLATVLQGSSHWLYGPSVCKLTAFASTFFIFGTVFGLCILALDRYLATVHRRFYVRRSRGLMCLAAVLIAWGAAFLLAFPPVFGLGTYRFNPVEAQCTFEFRYYTNNDTLGFIAIYIATMSLVTFLYTRVLVFLRRHRKMKPIMYAPPRSRMWNFGRPLSAVPLIAPAGVRPNVNAWGAPVDVNNDGNSSYHGNGPSRNSGPAVSSASPIQSSPNAVPYVCNCQLLGHVPRRRSYRNDHLTKLFLILTVVYAVFWLPYQAVSCWYMFDVQRRVPDVLLAFATWLTYAQVMVLPLIYLCCHRRLRKAVSQAFSWTASELTGSHLELDSLTVNT